MSDTVDMSIYRFSDGLEGDDLDIFNMLRSINASWVADRMPGTHTGANKQLVLMRVDTDATNLQALFASNTSPAWIISRMKQILPQVIVNGEGEPILDEDGNFQYEVIHEVKSNALDSQIKQFMVPNKDADGNDIPFTGLVRLHYHDNAAERDYPETVDFG
jgi:hypothetical protein